MTEEPKRQDRDAQRDEQKNTRWGKVVEFFSNNPTLVLTLLYLYVTAIGLIYSAALYGKFGINIFDYSEIGDFLLAAFKNPVAFVSVGVLAAISAAVLAYRVSKQSHLIRESEQLKDMRMQEMRRQQEELREELLQLEERGMQKEMAYLEHNRRMTVRIALILAFTIVFSTLMLPYYSASKTASSIKDGENSAVDVRYRSLKGSAGQVTEPNLTLIGATPKAVFFYDVDDRGTIVIPQAQIVSIEVPD